MTTLPLARRREVVAALRNGTVPRRGIEALATGLDRFERAADEDLAMAASGHGVFTVSYTHLTLPTSDLV